MPAASSDFPPSGSLTRRTVLGLVAAGSFARSAAIAEPVTRYLATLARPDGGYAWADEPESALTTTFAAIACHRLLGQEIPRKSEVARFVRGSYPMPETRRKDRPLHRFDYEQMQSLLWLGESIEEFRPAASEWTKPSYFTKNYEMHENPVLQQETGAILSRRLLQLPGTEEWRAYIAARRRANGSFNHTPAADGSDGHVTNTWWGLLALDALEMPADRQQETAAWLRACQHKGGGFTYAPQATIAAVDHVDYTWAALKSLKRLDGAPQDIPGARAYLLSLRNEDGGFADRPGRASNPAATWQALDALACLGPVTEVKWAAPHSRRRETPLPQNLRICSIQIEAPGTGSAREAAEMAAALRIDLWGAKNSQPGWIGRAQEIAREQKLPVTFFTANEEYGTYVDVPGLGTYSHLSDVIAPAGSEFGAPLSDKSRQPTAWQAFLDGRIAPLKSAGGSNVWQFNENEELSRVLLNQAVEQGTFSSIASFHFGNENFLKSQPFLNRYRDVMPFIGLQDAHTSAWWWMEFLVGFRTFFLAAQPTWAGWQEALRRNWIVAVRHDSRTDFRTEIAGGSNNVRQYVMDRQAQWKWWGDRPDQLIRPMASLVVVRPDEQFEEARPGDGVMLRLRPWWDTKPFGVPKIPVVELVSLEVDGREVKPELIHIEPKGPDRGDVFHQWHVAPDQKGSHTAVATLRHIQSSAVTRVSRKWTL